MCVFSVSIIKYLDLERRKKVVRNLDYLMKLKGIFLWIGKLNWMCLLIEEVVLKSGFGRLKIISKIIEYELYSNRKLKFIGNNFRWGVLVCCEFWIVMWKNWSLLGEF